MSGPLTLSSHQSHNFKECSFMQRLLCAVSIAVFLIPTGIGLADDAKTAELKSGPEIRKLLTEMEESFNRRDAKGLASCWTPHGDFVGRTVGNSRDARTSKRGFGSLSQRVRTVDYRFLFCRCESSVKALPWLMPLPR